MRGSICHKVTKAQRAQRFFTTEHTEGTEGVSRGSTPFTMRVKPSPPGPLSHKGRGGDTFGCRPLHTVYPSPGPWSPLNLPAQRGADFRCNGEGERNQFSQCFGFNFQLFRLKSPIRINRSALSTSTWKGRGRRRKTCPLLSPQRERGSYTLWEARYFARAAAVWRVCQRRIRHVALLFQDCDRGARRPPTR